MVKVAIKPTNKKSTPELVANIDGGHIKARGNDRSFEAMIATVLYKPEKLKRDCKNMTYILDWFHISMKFQNITIPDDNIELFSNIKWHLWHGNCDKALERLAEFVKIKEIVANHSLSTKLRELSTYIANNKAGIVNYEQRKNNGLVFTSNFAESTVNTLINARQKGKQKMLWSREGAHNVLQIRAAQRSKSWDNDWKSVENRIYKLAA
ncbi:uncharacterized protein TNCT_186411 [Trichonephila clavata]|uniref:Uncharacterized protein n=1 Tax=Trichonephila clavata TaxID=2740835 RepID=A0A8X6H458_TRICU|nr:uncharacterized protein TNCT_186411 [Trichonephila clavata]